MSYSLHLFDSSASTAQHLVTLGGRVESLTFAYGEHGCGDLRATLRLSLAEQMRIYARAGAPHVVVAYAGRPCWVGRLESATVASGLMQITAAGYYRALSDVPYTALWADYSLENWGVDSPAGSANGRFAIEKDTNQITIASRKGETFATGTNFGLVRWFHPDDGARKVTHVGFIYDITFPTNWRIQLSSADDGYASAASAWFIDANGANQTGSQFLTLGTPRDFVYFTVINNTGANSTPAGDTGANRAIFTVQYVTSRATNVYATQIVEALAAYINGINPTQLQATARATQVPAANGRTYEIYEDRYPADILKDLCRQEQYQAWVDLNQQLVFEPLGTGAQTWYVASGDLQVERALARVYNRRYATYQEQGGRTLRTANADSLSSQAREGLIRSAPVELQTTDATTAAAYRDLALADTATPTPRSQVPIAALRGAYGQPAPLHLPRAGDVAVVQNLPLLLASDRDQIGRFTIARAEVALARAAQPRLTLEPADPIPTLESALATLEIA